MKIIPFPLNDRDFKVSYHITNEGGNFFLCYYKCASVGRTDPKDAWRTLGVAKFTDTGKALKEWCLEMDATYGNQELEDVGRPDGSFASEVEPNDNTKMVT
tara:strand:+ start:336 stop:638 length:303 start_codon:yes stop_codon:yes gene_type:complete